MVHCATQSYIVCTKLIQCLGDFDLLLGVEECIGKLFSFSQCALDNLEAGDIAIVVANRLIGISSLWCRGRVGGCGGDGVAIVTYAMKSMVGILG